MLDKYPPLTTALVQAFAAVFAVLIFGNTVVAWLAAEVPPETAAPPAVVEIDPASPQDGEPLASADPCSAGIVVPASCPTPHDQAVAEFIFGDAPPTVPETPPETPSGAPLAPSDARPAATPLPPPAAVPGPSEAPRVRVRPRRAIAAPAAVPARDLIARALGG